MLYQSSRRRAAVIVTICAITTLILSILQPVSAFADTVSVTSSGPVSVAQSGPSPVTVGTPFVITVTATNTTTQLASNVILVFFEPVPISRIEPVTSGVVVCHKNASQLVFCEVASLAPGASLVVQLTLTSQSAGTFDSTAEAGGSIGGISSPTSVDLLLTVNPAPTDVQVTGSANTGSPPAGSSFTYTFQVKDNGPQPAPGVTFTDALPAGLTFVSASSSVGTCSQAGGTVSCTIGDLAVGAQAVISITVLAPTTTGTIINTGSASSTVTDTQPNNNNVSVTVQVK
jgi:uncharacterized repeat protein (TIGR01451 family)